MKSLKRYENDGYLIVKESEVFFAELCGFLEKENPKELKKPCKEFKAKVQKIARVICYFFMKLFS